MFINNNNTYIFYIAMFDGTVYNMDEQIQFRLVFIYFSLKNIL